MTEFQNQKTQRLQHVDLSRKGSVDEPVFELVAFVNSMPNYFTTSSCSGRIILFENSGEDIDDNASDLIKQYQASNQMKIGKKGCKWLFVSHSNVSSAEGDESFCKASSCAGNAVFKFEAMVMHIQCQNLEDAQQMHQAAVAAGFRNSGISVGGKRKIIVGVRSTHGLEVPLTKDGRIFITKEYYEYLIDCANQKMEENFVRINRFFDNVKAMAQGSNTAGAKESKRNKREARKAEKLARVERREAPQKDQMPMSPSQCNNDLEDETDELSLFVFENT